MRSLELVAAHACWRGFQASAAAAEGFVAVRITDPTPADAGAVARAAGGAMSPVRILFVSYAMHGSPSILGGLGELLRDRPYRMLR